MVSGVVSWVISDIEVQIMDTGCYGSGHGNVPGVWTGLKG